MKPGEARRIDDVIHTIETEAREKEQRFRDYMKSIGREDLLAEYEANMRDLRLGITTARSTWDALSARQRLVLNMLTSGFKLRRSPRKATLYDAHGSTKVILDVCRIKTLRNLSARELAHVAGPVLDPEALFVVTERGVFVSKHGKGEGQ